MRHTAYIYVRLVYDRDKFQSVPTITVGLKGLKIYNPITQVTEWTNDPALCTYDMLARSASRGGFCNLSWSDNASNEDGYEVYRGTSSGSLVLIGTLGANATSFADSGLTKRVTYYYKVCAYNGDGEGCSSVISVRAK